MKKILSISVAAYNAENWLNRCIDSMVIPEILELIEIIIVNDGSSDKTLEIAKQYESLYPQSIVVINKDNGGHGSTINVAKKIAKGKYFKVVDADDWVNRDGFIALVNRLVSIKKDIVFSPYYVYLLNEEKYLPVDYFYNSEIFDYEKDNLQLMIERLKISMHSIVINTDVVKKMPDIDEQCFYVDVEYVVYSMLKCNSVSFLREPVYVYYIGREGQSVNVNIMFKRREQHFRVCKSIINYYVNYSNEKSIFDNVIHSRIVALVIKHYKILLLNKNLRESKREFVNFDNWLKESAPIIYKASAELNQFFSKFLFLMRISGFHGYELFVRKINKRIRLSIQNSF